MVSPTLFNLVLDPLLSALRQRNLSLSINGLYLGAFSHTDDICTCATNIEDVCKQVSIVDTFTKSRGSNSSTMGSAISKTQTLSEHVRKWMLDRQMFSFVGSSASITFQALKRCHFFIYVLDRRMATRNAPLLHVEHGAMHARLWGGDSSV